MPNSTASATRLAAAVRDALQEHRHTPDAVSYILGVLDALADNGCSVESTVAALDRTGTVVARMDAESVTR